MTDLPMVDLENTKIVRNVVIQVVSENLIPIKHRLIQPTPMELYLNMHSGSDITPVIRTMIQERWVKSEDRARECIFAMFQWMATGALVHEKVYLMFHGQIDKAFHAAILNTKWYRDFCNEHIGCYVHHDPLDKEQASKVVSEGGIHYTVNKLVNAFGDKLHPELMKWVLFAKKEKLGISNVSCVCNGA